jgi:hypothetical protein
VLKNWYGLALFHCSSYVAFSLREKYAKLAI